MVFRNDGKQVIGFRGPGPTPYEQSVYNDDWISFRKRNQAVFSLVLGGVGADSGA